MTSPKPISKIFRGRISLRYPSSYRSSWNFRSPLECNSGKTDESAECCGWRSNYYLPANKQLAVAFCLIACARALAWEMGQDRSERERERQSVWLVFALGTLALQGRCFKLRLIHAPSDARRTPRGSINESHPDMTILLSGWSPFWLVRVARRCRRGCFAQSLVHFHETLRHRISPAAVTKLKAVANEVILLEKGHILYSGLNPCDVVGAMYAVGWASTRLRFLAL